MKLKNKRTQIIEYGNIGARPVTSAAASLKNADDYRQKPKTSALDAKLSKAFHDMQGQKLSIKAGIERSTIPDEIDEIADDYDYDQEYEEYNHNYDVPTHMKKGATHTPESFEFEVKNAPVHHMHPEDLENILNMDVMHRDIPGWKEASTEDRLQHVKHKTRQYKRYFHMDKAAKELGYRNLKDGRKKLKGRKEIDSLADKNFNQHWDSLVNHIVSGKNDKEESMHPSILAPKKYGRGGDIDKQHLIGGNTRSMIHQALGKPIPVKIIEPFQSVQEEYQINDIRYKAKLLIEKKEEELYVQKKREEWQWKERQWRSKKSSSNKAAGVRQ